MATLGSWVLGSSTLGGGAAGPPSGGSVVAVSTAATGGGTPRSFGGSTAGVSAAGVGTGAQVHAGQGGSTTIVTAAATGDGSARRTGGAVVGVGVGVTGTGAPVAPGGGGTVVTTGAAAVGSGSKVGVGSGVLTTVAGVVGTGRTLRSGGGLTTVAVTARSPLGQRRDVEIRIVGPQGHPFAVGAARGHPLRIRRIRVELHPEGQELARFTLEGLPDNPGQVSLRLNGGAWIDVTPDADGVVSLLVRGPLAPQDAQAIEVPVGLTYAEGRLVDNPERPIRAAGEIRVGL